MDDVTRIFMALHPEVTISGLEAIARFDPQPEHRGVEGWLHGGMAATVLDHISARCAAAALDARVVTGTLDLRYRHPVLLADGPYELRATALSVRQRIAKVEASIRSYAGVDLVTSTSLFAVLPASAA